MIKTFGNEIEDFEDMEARLAAEAELAKEITAEVININTPEIDKAKLHQINNTLDFKTHSKDPKSKKVKFKNVAKYILTELALLDELYEDCQFEIAALECLDDPDEDTIEKLEIQLSEINGAVDALYQMGRYFGVSKDMLDNYIPNIQADEYAISEQINQG